MDLQVLFQSLLATRAGSAGIHKTSDSGKFAYYKIPYTGTNGRYPSYNFMAWYHGKYGSTPFIPGLVNIRMADARDEWGGSIFSHGTRP